MLQEELAEGLHMIDFEQLKIENQTYNEKIEERNEVIKDYCVKMSLSFLLSLFNCKQPLSFAYYEFIFFKGLAEVAQENYGHRSNADARQRKAPVCSGGEPTAQRTAQ